MWAERAGVPLDVVLRDVPDSIMDDFPTNGGRSIPVWTWPTAMDVSWQWGRGRRQRETWCLPNAEIPEPAAVRSSPHRSNCGMHGTRGEIEHEALALLNDLGQSALKARSAPILAVHYTSNPST